VEQVCRCCGKVFTANYIAKVPYCSKECRKESRRRICQECGKVYYPSSKGAAYGSKCCSKACLDAYRNRISIKKRKRVCETCGKEFIMPYMSGKGKRGESNEGRFCSRKCHGASMKSIFPSCKVYFPVCDVCGEVFTSRFKRARCSRECDLEYGRRYYRDNAEQTCAKMREEYKLKWVQPEPFKCQWCGRLHQPKYGDTSTVYCSETCRQRAKRKLSHNSNNRYLRDKAQRDGERFKPVTVLKRDGWRCQLCGKKLNPKHRGTHRDDAPELDHIIPLSLGGEHSKRNTQCACRKCNLSKSNSEIGQLRLFG